MAYDEKTQRGLRLKLYSIIGKIDFLVCYLGGAGSPGLGLPQISSGRPKTYWFAYTTQFNC